MILLKNTKLLVLVLLLATAGFALFEFWDILISVFAAAVIAYLLGPLARWLERRSRLSHGASVAVVIVAVFVLFVLLISFSLPYLIGQISSLVQDVTGTASNLDELVEMVQSFLRGQGLPEPALESIMGFAAQLDSYILGLLSTVLQWLVSLSLGILDLVVLVIMIVYFMLDGVKITATALAALPQRLRESAERVMQDGRQLTRRYIRTRVMLSAGMAAVTYVGLTVMGIRYAPLFALMSFVFDFIPYFGSIAAGVVEALYALVAHGPVRALMVLAFVLVVQQLEGNVVAPKVEGDATGIHPIAVIVSLLICNQIFGPVGMLISTPLAAIAKSILWEAYRYVVSPDEEEGDGEAPAPAE